VRKTVSSFLAGLIALLVLPTLLAAPAQAAERDVACGGGGTFKIVDTVITSHSDCKGDIQIPADVTSIGDWVFHYSEIKAVTFQDGSNLKNLKGHFHGSTMTSIDLPNGLESISHSAFRSTNLTTLSIPGTVWDISYQVFQQSKVENLIFEPRIDSRLNLNGAMLGYSGVKSVTFMGPTATSFSLANMGQPNGYRWVGWSEGQGGSIITFPYKVTEEEGITLYAVGVQQVITTHECSTAGTFEIRDNVVKSSTATCAGAVEIPAKVTEIGQYAFKDRNITSVTFAEPSELKLIGMSAFENTKFTSIDLPNSLENIGITAFGSSALTSLSIPGNVTELQSGIAGNSKLLTAFVFEARIAPWPVNFPYSLALNGLPNLSSIKYTGRTTVDGGPYNPNNQKGGFAWLHWSTSLGGPEVTFPVTTSDPEGITLYTNWTPATYTATYEDTLGGAVVAPTSIVGGQITFPTPPTRTGYTFCGWYESFGDRACDYGSPITDWFINNDPKFFSRYAPNTRAVNFIENGGSEMPNGRIHTNQEWHIESHTWQDTYTKRVGHRLTGWSFTPDGEPIEFPIRDRLVTEDINLYAIWELKKRSIGQSDYRNAWSGFMDGSFFEYGSTIMEAPTPLFDMKNCHAFDGWSVTNGGPAISFPYTPNDGQDEDFWLHAVVKSAPCAVTVAENGAQSVSVPAGVTEAIMPATAQLPEISLNLAGVTGDAVVTVAPISNPAAAEATPFAVTAETKVVDINVEGVTGNVIVCLDGGPTDNVYHFTGGKWEALPERTYANGKVCGVTSNFSPFAAEAPKAANNPAPVVVNPAPEVVNPAPEVVSPAPVVNNPVPAAPAAPVVDNSAALAAAADLAARTVSVKKTLAPNALAKKVGVKVSSSKAKVTMKVAGSSKKNCAVVAGKLKTLKAGNCVVSFTVQEPKPAKGKQPKATKATKTLVVK
jgi:hypothetical protein